MPQAKKSPKVIDLKKIRSSIQENEKNNDKLLALVGEKTLQPEDVFKLPASKYMPYRFDLCTTDENTTDPASDNSMSDEGYKGDSESSNITKIVNKCE